MKNSLIFGLIISLFFVSFNLKKPTIDELSLAYVDKYKELAVVEMHRSGIPASITLAQGLHESNCGTSKLTLMSNNHFGIKCKSYWVGKTYYHKDDDYDQMGNLIESCFRSYSSALESYVDHSNFLLNTKHYAPLFSYDSKDYRAWAYGLKECGYASDIRYAEKLIEKIEKYQLNQYDYWDSPYRSSLKK